MELGMKLKRIAPLFIAPILTACSGTDGYNVNKNNVEHAIGKADSFMGAASNSELYKKTSRVLTERGAYFGSASQKIYNGNPLPSRFEGNSGVTIRSGMPISIDNILSLIQDATKIPVDKRIYASLPSSGGVPANVADKLNKAAGEPTDPSNVVMSVSNPDTNRQQMQINYTGSLSELLNLVALNYDLFWVYEEGRIVFSDEETRQFAISVLPGKYTTKSSVGSEGESSGGGSGSGGSSSGGGSNSGNNSKLDLDVSLDFWKDIEESIKLIIGDSGTFSISTSTSSITVRTTPSNMKRVSEYIESLNKKLERQVTIDVAVYSVSTSDTNNLSLSLQALLKKNGGIIGSIGSNFASSEGTPSITGFLNADGDTNNQVLLNMLAEVGKVSVVTSAAVTTMSGQPVPLKVGNDRTYISEIGTVLGQTSTTTSASTSSVTTGFLMNLLPQVGDEGQIFLQYGITMSSLVGKNDGFDQAKVGDTIIQLPNIDSTTFVQSSMLKNGNTLVLAGYDQKRNETVDQGLGTPNFKLLGGAQNGTGRRDIKIICITPRIIDVKGLE